MRDEDTSCSDVDSDVDRVMDPVDPVPQAEGRRLRDDDPAIRVVEEGRPPEELVPGQVETEGRRGRGGHHIPVVIVSHVPVELFDRRGPDRVDLLEDPFLAPEDRGDHGGVRVQLGHEGVIRVRDRHGPPGPLLQVRQDVMLDPGRVGEEVACQGIVRHGSGPLEMDVSGGICPRRPSGISVRSR